MGGMWQGMVALESELQLLLLGLLCPLCNQIISILNGVKTLILDSSKYGTFKIGIELKGGGENNKNTIGLEKQTSLGFVALSNACN